MLQASTQRGIGSEQWKQKMRLEISSKQKLKNKWRKQYRMRSTENIYIWWRNHPSIKEIFTESLVTWKFHPHQRWFWIACMTIRKTLMRLQESSPRNIHVSDHIFQQTWSTLLSQRKYDRIGGRKLRRTLCRLNQACTSDIIRQEPPRILSHTFMP